MKKTTFVFWGYSGEAVLHPLKERMLEKGFNCISLPDIEAFPTKKDEYEYLKSIEFVLITSSHFTRDKDILRDFYPEIEVNLSIFEIIKFCKPIKSIFYPHDLVTPLVLNEPLFATYFDLVLWPLGWYGYYPKPKNLVLDIGWIKYSNTSKESNENLALFEDKDAIKCFFFSEICTYHKAYGIEKTLKKFQPLIENKIPIKCPDWPISHEYEQAIKKHGGIVIPSTLNSFDIIKNAQLIISNGLSSIISEAYYMGVPTINIKEGDFVGTSVLQDKLFHGFQNCVQCSYSDLNTILTKHTFEKAASIIRPFNYKKAIDEIKKIL